MSKGGQVRAVGVMPMADGSGIIAAEVETDGTFVGGFGATACRHWSDGARAALDTAARSGAVPLALTEMIETAHAELLSRFGGADIAGFHGVTVAVDPQGREVRQTGDGSILAEVLGVPVVWDFRGSDIALGGLGGPLTPFFHHACARRAGIDAPVAFLDLGAMATLTWLDSRAATPDAPGACLAFDAGPGLGAAGEGGGRPSQAVLAALAGEGHFLRVPPKLLPPGEFTALRDGLARLSAADAAATSAEAVAFCVARGIEHVPAPPAWLFVSGPGRDDDPLRAALARQLPCPVAPVEALGLDGDATGARAIAHLAVRVARGLPTTCPGTTGVAASVGGGRISRPSPPPNSPDGGRALRAERNS